MTLFMESTEISAEKTAAQVVGLLAQSGARKIMQDYEGGKIVALSFTMMLNGQESPFRLPINTNAIVDLMKQREKAKKSAYHRRSVDVEQCERIAWRQVYRWLQAQLALLETNMVTSTEIFLPYLLLANRQTLYRELERGNFKSLPPLLDHK